MLKAVQFGNAERWQSVRRVFERNVELDQILVMAFLIEDAEDLIVFEEAGSVVVLPAMGVQQDEPVPDASDRFRRTGT